MNSKSLLVLKPVKSFLFHRRKTVFCRLFSSLSHGHRQSHISHYCFNSRVKTYSVWSKYLRINGFTVFWHPTLRFLCSKGDFDKFISKKPIDGVDLSNVHDVEAAEKEPITKEMKDLKLIMERLSTEEKQRVLFDIQMEETERRKKEAEEKLASWAWRSKFGRPTSIHPSKVDPSGTYCEIPQDWLLKKVAESSKDRPPKFSELRKVALFNALPFVGFGFLDNLVMIIAGDYIDLTIGTYLGITTMAAAALGNTISDLAGIGSAWYVEILASKIGVRPPELSYEQENMASTRWVANLGRGLGVCIGCIIGMFPLLFLPTHKPRTTDASKAKSKDAANQSSAKGTPEDENVQEAVSLKSV